MFIGSSVSLPRTKKIATIVAISPKARTTSGKKIQASGLRPARGLRDREDGDTEDHRADVLGGRRLEEVGATAGAVADVVADEVRDDARVAGVVLGDALLDLADEVRADVGGLGVDAAAELGEQRDERGAEPEADDEERGIGDGHVTHEGVVQGEDAPHAEEGQGDDEEARDGAAAHRDLDRLDEAAPGGRRRPDVGPDGDEHADDPRRHRARRTDQECERGHDPDRQAGELGHVRDFWGLDEGDHRADDDRADEREDRDGRVLTPDEGDRALVDRAGDVLHLDGPGVTRQDVPGQVEREQDGDDAGRQDDQLERTGIHQVRRSSTLGLLTRCRPRLVAGATRGGRTGECCLWSRRHAPASWDLAGRRRV